MRMRRLPFLLLCLVMILVVGNPVFSGPSKLTVWADSFFTPQWQGGQGPILDKIWKQFEKENNAVIDLQLVPYPEFQAKLLSALRAKTAPDAVIADQYWLASMIKTGGVQEISAYWPEKERKDFFPWAVEGTTVGGKIYGIWYTTDARVLYYRKDLLQKGGFNEPPGTWDELVKTAQALHTSDVYGLGMVFQGEGGMCTLLIDFWSLGGELTDADGKPIFHLGKNKEALIKVLNFYDQLYNKYKVTPKDSVAYTTENDMNQRILAGGYNMFFGGGWQIGIIQDNLPPKDAKNWEIAVRPVPPGGKPSSMAGGFDLNVLASNPTTKRLAAKFIQHLAKPNNMAKFAAASRGLPVRMSVWENDSFFATDHYMQQYHAILDFAKTRPNSVVYPIISEKVMVALGQVLSGQKNASQAIDDAGKAVLAAMQ